MPEMRLFRLLLILIYYAGNTLSLNNKSQFKAKEYIKYNFNTYSSIFQSHNYKSLFFIEKPDWFTQKIQKKPEILNWNENDFKENINIKIQSKDVYSSSTLYPLYDKVLLGLIKFFNIDSNPYALIKNENNNLLIYFYSAQWSYYMLFLMNSSLYFSSMKGNISELELQLRSLYPFFDDISNKNNFFLKFSPPSKENEVDNDDIEYINYVLTRADELTSFLEFDFPEEILNKKEYEAFDEILYLKEIHSQMQIYLDENFPNIGYELIINNNTFKYFISFMKFILKEGVFYNMKDITSAYPNQVDFINKYFSLIDNNNLILFGCIINTPFFRSFSEKTILNSSNDYASILFTNEKNKAKGDISDQFNLLLSFDKRQLKTNYNTEDKSLHLLFPQFDNINNLLLFGKELLELDYDQIIFNKELINNQIVLSENTIKTIISISKFIKYASYIDTSFYSSLNLSPVDINYNLLSLFRVRNLKNNIDDNIILYCLLKKDNQYLTTDNEIKALLDYKDFIENLIYKKKTSENEEMNIEKLTIDYLIFKREYKNGRISKGKSGSSYLNMMRIIIRNKIILNSYDKIIYNRIGNYALKDDVLTIKKKICEE